MNLEIFYSIYTFLIVGLCLYLGGIAGAAVGMLLSKITVLVSVYLAKKITICHDASLLTSLLPAIVSSLFLAVGSYTTAILAKSAGVSEALFVPVAILVGAFMAGGCLIIFCKGQFKEVLSTASVVFRRTAR